MTKCAHIRGLVQKKKFLRSVLLQFCPCGSSPDLPLKIWELSQLDSIFTEDHVPLQAGEQANTLSTAANGKEH